MNTHIHTLNELYDLISPHDLRKNQTDEGATAKSGDLGETQCCMKTCR